MVNRVRAFLKTRKMPRALIFLFKLLWIKWEDLIKGSIVDNMLERNPNWFGDKMLCLFIKDINLVLMHLSKI